MVGVERGLEKQSLEIQPTGKKAFSLSCPAAPTPLPPLGVTGKRPTVALHHLLGCPVCRRQAKITADTCQAIPPQGQWLTDSNKLLRTMDLRHKQTCNQCTLQRSVKTEGGAVGSVAFCYNCNCTRLALSCLSVSISGHCFLTFVGPAALFSLQLSYVLFMLSVECPALALVRLAVPNRGQWEQVPASASGLGSGISVMAWKEA